MTDRDKVDDGHNTIKDPSSGSDGHGRDVCFRTVSRQDDGHRRDDGQSPDGMTDRDRMTDSGRDDGTPKKKKKNFFFSVS